ncbi:MAG: MBL fold metallo-hydrolase [Deltaproteobacteria bacterium]|jgi:glyoxylase-like metal-dependent hydrolase (beta-lactamase superfamily II)|nr:MBL fold metallo-hydrolase [Deltaproteobacteria bacterium]
MFIQQIEVGRFSVFAYLLGEDAGGEGLVIDPADEVDEIIALAKSKKIAIKTILNTHAHVDHIMGNEEMKRKTGAKIIIHEDDAPLLTQTPRSMLAMFGGRPSPPADQTVKDGEIIRAGEVSLKVLHTPGHSPGGMCLYGEGVVFTGDTLFVGGLGRTDLPGGSWEVMLNSIRTKLLTLPDETIVYPGHNYGPSPKSTVKNERLYNPFLK